MTPDVWVDLAYSALVAGAIALFFREYDSEAQAEQWVDSIGGFHERRGEALVELRAPWRGKERRHAARPRQTT
jgi:hypothetical protein